MAETDITLSLKVKPDKIKEALAELKNDAEAIFNKTGSSNKTGSNKVTQNLDKMQEQVDRSTHKVDDLGKKIEEVANKQVPAFSREIETALNKTGDSKLEHSLHKIQDQLDKTIRKMEELEKGTAQLEDKKIPTEEYAALEKQLEALNKRFEDITSKQEKFLETGGKENSRTYQQMNYDLDTLEDKIRRTEESMYHLREEGKAFTLGADSDKYQKMIQQQEELNNKIRQYLEAIKIAQTQEQVRQDKAVERAQRAEEAESRRQEATINRIQAQEQAARAKEVAEDLAFRKAEEARQKTEEAQQESERLSKIATNKSAIVSFYSQWISHVKSLTKRIVDLGVKVAQTTKKLLLMIASRIRSGIQKLSSSIKGLGGNALSTDFSMKKLFWTLMKYGLGIRSLFFLFRKLRSAMAEGFENMAKYKEGATSTGRAINSLKNNLIYLKNAWAAAFAPLATYVIPIINKAIGWLGAISEKIAAFFSLLTGKKSMLVAVKNASGYETALDKTKKKVEQNTKAQKKWNNELYGWDELNKQQEKDEDQNPLADTADQMNDAVNAADKMFKEVPVKGILPQWLEDWINKLKELWKNGEWFKLGEHIAELFNKGLKFLDDWINNTFRPWGVKWAKRIAEILNGFVHGLDWKLLGKTLADGVNAIFDILNTFLTTFDFAALGRGIGEAIYSWFDTIDWKLIGETFANGWNALINLIYGIVSTPELFKKIGESIQTMVDSWFETIQWEKAAIVLRTLVNGVFESIDAFFGKKSKIPQHIKRITNALNIFFQGIEWKKNGETIANALNVIVKAFQEFATNLKWEEIGAGVGQFFKSIFENIDVETIQNTLTSFWEGIKSFFISMMNEMGITPEDVIQFAEDLGTIVAEAINSFFHSEIFKTYIKTAFTYIASVIAEIDWVGIASDIWDSLNEAFSNLDQDKQQKLSEIFINILKGAAALVAASTTLSMIGSIIVEAISTAIVDGFASVSLGSMIAEKIVAVVNGIAVSASGATVTIGGFAMTGIVGIGAAIAAGIVTAISMYFAGKNWLGPALFPEDKDWYAEFKLLPGLQDIGKGIYEGITGQIQISAGGFINFLQEQFVKQHELGQVGQFIVNGIVDGILLMMGGPLGPIFVMMKYMDQLITKVKEVLKIDSPSQVFYDIGINVIEGLVNGIKALWNTIPTFLTTNITNLITKVKEKVKEFKSVGINIVEGIRQGIKEKWDSLKDYLNNLAQQLPDAIKTVLKIESPSKVFAEIGGFISLGLAEGIDDESNAPQAAINEMVENLVGNVQKEADIEIAPKITTDEMTNNLDLALERLATIADKFNMIAEAFNTISNIPIPDIAAGKVVPQAALAGTSNAEQQETQFQSLADKLADILSNIVIPAQSTSDKVISININGREVFNAVVDENNREVQRTGQSPLRV